MSKKPSGSTNQTPAARRRHTLRFINTGFSEGADSTAVTEAMGPNRKNSDPENHGQSEEDLDATGHKEMIMQPLMSAGLWDGDTMKRVSMMDS